MPANCNTSVASPIFKGKGDIMNCGMYRGVKLLEHAMKIVEKVLDKGLRKVITINDMQFGCIPGKGAFILRRIQEECSSKQKKLYMYFAYLEKAFDRVPKKVVKWAMRRIGITEALVGAVMSLYKGAKIHVKDGTHLSE